MSVIEGRFIQITIIVQDVRVIVSSLVKTRLAITRFCTVAKTKSSVFKDDPDQ